MKALALAAVVFATAAYAQQPMRWEVPGLTSRVEVAGLPVAQGIPMKLTMATSSLQPAEAIAHYAADFAQNGLYIPPARDQLEVEGALQLTALDVDRLFSYTVIARALPDNRGSRLLLSIASLDEPAAQKAEPLVSLYPGATAALTTQGEGSRTLSYLVAATAAQIEAFHSAALTKAGFTRDAEGVFVRGGDALKVSVRPQPDGRAAVVIKHTGSQGSGSSSTSITPP